LRSASRVQRPGALAWLLPVLAVGCGSELEPKRPSNVAAVPGTEIATVVQVTWHTDEPTIGFVEYGTTQAMEWSTPLEATPSREHSATLFSLHAGTAYSYRVVTWDGDAGVSDILSFRTAPLPSGLPAFTATGSFDSYVVVPVRGAAPAVVVLDPAGAVVWYHSDDSGLDVLRARFSEDRRSILYNRTEVDEDSTEESAIVRVALDGSATDVIAVPFLAHDFVELEGNRFAAIVVDRREAGGQAYRGDAIVEIAADGSTTPVWSTWDSFDPIESPGDGLNGAWTYANALEYSSNENAYYVGLQNFSSVLRVPAAGGDPDWVLGSTEATLTFADGNTPFTRQSGIARFTDDDMFIVDNGGSGGGARVVEYSLNLDTGQAVELGRYAPMPAVSVGELGGIVRWESGTWVISWGDAGRIELVEDETSTWSLRADGTRLGYHDVATSLYPEGTDARNPLR
jgi:hypothetical protein